MKIAKTLGIAALMVGCGLLPATASAETVNQTTKTTQIELPNTQKIDFKVFDLNHNGILSRAEVGEELFYIFDQDGNHVLDNHEYDHKAVLTIIPMKSETETIYDFDDDGKVDATKFTYETFTEQSGLMRFEKTPGGLSPREFTEKGFNELDVNHDHTLGIDEWKGAYNEVIDRHNKEVARVNQ
jgi:hypothetical protein